MDRVVNLLKKYGPMISGDLARKYEQIYNTSNEAARKAVSRSKSPVNKISNLRFDKNQKFYYLESQFMSNKYKENLLESIKNHSKIIFEYINAFLMQNGYISKRILPAYVGAPVENVKGHRIHFDIIQILIDNNIVIDENEDILCLNPSFFEKVNYNHSIGLEIAKKTIINDFNQWAREANLVSYSKGKTFFEQPVFGHFQWCYSAPSYIQPLYSTKCNKPGFVVADVIFGKTTTLSDLNFFIDKLLISRSFKNLPSFLPVIIVDRIDRDALNKLKELNVFVALLDQFFSDKYTKLLNELVNVITNATSIINKNPDYVHHLFESLSKSEGKYNNMAGDLFELLVGYHFSTIGCSYMKSKQIIRYDNKMRELDWLIKKDGKTVVVECKATKSKIDERFVNKWLTEKIPITYKWLIDNQYNRIQFELWSVGGFTDKALEILSKQEKEVKKYRIYHYSKEDMIKIAKNTNDQNFIDIIKQHFSF